MPDLSLAPWTNGPCSCQELGLGARGVGMGMPVFHGQTCSHSFTPLLPSSPKTLGYVSLQGANLSSPLASSLPILGPWEGTKRLPSPSTADTYLELRLLSGPSRKTGLWIPCPCLTRPAPHNYGCAPKGEEPLGNSYKARQHAAG